MTILASTFFSCVMKQQVFEKLYFKKIRHVKKYQVVKETNFNLMYGSSEFWLPALILAFLNLSTKSHILTFVLQSIHLLLTSKAAATAQKSIAKNIVPTWKKCNFFFIPLGF